MPVAMVRDVHIVYEIIGTGGPWVILTPGGRRSHAEFTSLAGLIAAQGFRVLLHDRRNTGASEIRISGAAAEEVQWADDLVDLAGQLGASPAFIGGSSSGARLSLLVALRHPKLVRGLLLFRVTGGAFAAGRLPEMYYGQYIRAAEQGGMAAVCATEQYRERIAANPDNERILMAMDPAAYIATMRHWQELFVAGAQHPILGVSAAEMAAITVPTLVVPGNDLTHSRASGLLAHDLIKGSELHELDIAQTDLPLIQFEDWADQEPALTKIFTDFMRRVDAAGA